MTPESLNLIGHAIVGEIATVARSHRLKRDDFPRLSSDSATERMEAVMLHEGVGRVDLPGTIKRFMKQRFPSFSFAGRLGDLHRFSSKASVGELYVEFERIHHYGLGKTFTVHIGAVHANAIHNHHGFRTNVMAFFDRASMNWTYGSADELKDCLEEAAVLLAIVLPPYQAAWETKRLEDLPPLKPLTFHQAAETAYRRFEAFYPQFSAMGHAALIDGGPSLRPTGTWAVSFNDNALDRTLRVEVLPTGQVLFGLGNQAYVRRGKTMFRAHPRRYPDEHLTLPAEPVESRPTRDRPWEAFLDSPRAVETAADHGGADFLATSSDVFTQVQFHAQRSDPPLDDEEWRIFYHDRTPTRRHLNVRMSARSGEVLPAL